MRGKTDPCSDGANYDSNDVSDGANCGSNDWRSGNKIALYPTLSQKNGHLCRHDIQQQIGIFCQSQRKDATPVQRGCVSTVEMFI